jgi:hypothetical protein
VEYRVLSTGLVLSSDRCDWTTDAVEFADRKTKSGKPYRASFCFPAQKAEDGRMLVPYSRDEKYTYLNEKYSADVTTYTKQFARNFEPSAQQEQEAETTYFNAAWQQRGQAAVGTIFSAFVFWLVSKAIGWVMRGFMGIPSGHDKKPTASSQQTA